MYSRIKRTLKSLVFGVKRDAATGHLYYELYGKRLYIRTPDECERPHHRKYAFEEIYFKHYRPKKGDVVVDFGAGLGTEILRLAAVESDIRYIAVEIQPWVFECLCLTFAQLADGYEPYGLAVGKEQVVHISPTLHGIDASLTKTGEIPVECVTWSDFVQRHQLAHVDLLKMNIEGAEADLLDHIDLKCVRRVIVSVHDFKADRGEGERYRTRREVEGRLVGAGFNLTRLQGEKDWMRSWVYAERGVEI